MRRPENGAGTGCTGLVLYTIGSCLSTAGNSGFFPRPADRLTASRECCDNVHARRFPERPPPATG